MPERLGVEEKGKEGLFCPPIHVDPIDTDTGL